jgi:phospholipid/cholesterol/gamma-HCH transport system substrate-binding protein
VLLNAKQFLAPENARRLNQTLAHLEQLTGTLANQRAMSARPCRNWPPRRARPTWPCSRPTSCWPRAAMTPWATCSRRSLAASSQQIEKLIQQNQAALNNGARGGRDRPGHYRTAQHLASVRAISRKLESNPGGYLLGQDNLQEFNP